MELASTTICKKVSIQDTTRANKKIEPYRIAVLYYFGELGYWKMPRIAQDALEQGYDGPALRRLAGLINPVDADIDPKQIDTAFREMGVSAPLSKDEARLSLAAEVAAKALYAGANVFDQATHIAGYLCEWHDPLPELRRIVSLAQQSRTSSNLEKLETELRQAMADFLRSRQSN